MSSTGRFSRSDRLLDSRDFKRVSRRGRRLASKHFVMLRAPSRKPTTRLAEAGVRGHEQESEHVRLGITVSRKVGNAVVRNYIKRNVREWFRAKRNAQSACDLVVIARREAADLSGLELFTALDELWMSPTKQGRS